MGSVLNCPTGATTPELDSVECATEGWERPGPYVVRKSHFILTDEVECAAVPEPHHLAWRNLTDEKIIFIFRDPRDIVVSGAHYYRITIQEMIYNMIHGTGELKELGPWLDYMEQWLDLPFDVTYISYEALIAAPVVSVIYMLHDMGLGHEVDADRIEAAVEYQSFDVTKRRIAHTGHRLNRGRSFNYWFLRMGIVGDWENLFGLDDCVLVYDAWQPMLERLKYVDTKDWWHYDVAMADEEIADLLKTVQSDPRYHPADTGPYVENDAERPGSPDLLTE